MLNRPRWQVAWGVALFIWGGGLCGVRLFNLLAFEFALACSIPLSFLGAYCAFKTRDDGASPWRQWRVASQSALMLGLIPIVPISLNAFWVKNCNWLDGITFYVLLSLMSCVVASGWGIIIKRMIQRRSRRAYPGGHDEIESEEHPFSIRRGMWIFGGIFVGAVLWGLVAFFTTPGVDVFSTFIGYYPGALYDEEMLIGSRLAISRLEDLTVITCLLVLLDQEIGRGGRLKMMLGMLLIHIWGWSVDLHRPAWWVQYRLGGLKTTTHYRVYHPESWESDRVELLATELEFNHQELTDFFQRAPEQPIHVYFYRDAQHKKRLMGAGRTLIAKPWQYGIHLHAPQVGDRVITHELAHAFSAEIAPAPHHLSLWRGVLPNMSLIEGLAVAAAWTRGRGSGLMSRLTPHQWTAAMRRLDLAPPMHDLFNPQSFYAYNARVSYTTCGSFVRFFRRTRGVDALNQLYASGGEHKELAQSIKEWEQWLDERVLSPRLIDTASSMLGGTSIFYKVCAHDLAARRSEALAAEIQGERQRALEIWNTIDTDKPQDAQSLLRRISIFAGMGRLETASQLVAEALKAQQDSAPFRYMTALRLREWSIDLDWFLKRQTPQVIHEAYQQQLQLGMGRPRWRRLAVKRYALAAQTPIELGEVIFDFFRQSSSPEDRNQVLAEALERWPESGELYYLKARVSQGEGSSNDVERLLTQAVSLGLSHPSLTYEALRLQAALYFQQRRYVDAQRVYSSLAQRSDLLIEKGEQQELELWARRALFFHRILSSR